MGENQAIVRYNYRLRPGVIALARLEREWNCARWVWNQCVEAGNAAYEAYKEGIKHESPTWCRMAKKLTGWRAEFKWLRENSQCVQQQAIRKWAQSHQQAFRQPEKGFPKFKNSKSSRPSMEYVKNGFRIKEGRLCLVGGISIPVVWSRGLPSIPSSCVISREPDGHWNVSFVVRRESKPLPPCDAAIGIDWGVCEVATTTTPEFNLPCGDQVKNSAKELKEANRKLSRAMPGSRGRSVAKLRVSRIHLKIARQRKDRAHKWAKRVVVNFGKIAVEDFKPRFLAKTTMAKKATDGAVGMTKRILLTKAKAAKRECFLVDPAYTTMTCASCGTRNKLPLALRERTFVCESCGISAGRDENAARVIRARAGFNPTNVDDVRPLHGLGCAVAV